MNRLLPLILGALIAAFALPTAVAAKPHTSHAYTVPVTGTLADGSGTVAGDFTIDRFVHQGDGIAAVGSFTGSVTDAAGNVTSGTQALALPVTLPGGVETTAGVAAAATCPVLHLELGPLDLNLLGLMVHLDKVVLDITAAQGPGNLLGNLLCAIAGLLDPGPGPLAAITALLNRILAILQTL